MGGDLRRRLRDLEEQRRSVEGCPDPAHRPPEPNHLGLRPIDYRVAAIPIYDPRYLTEHGIEIPTCPTRGMSLSSVEVLPLPDWWESQP